MDSWESEQMDWLLELTPFRRRSALEFVKTFHKRIALVSYRGRCGKPGCRCTRGERHGPYWYVRWREDGRQRRRYVKPEELEAVRAEVNQLQMLGWCERQARRGTLADLRELKRWLREMENELFR